MGKSLKNITFSADIFFVEWRKPFISGIVNISVVIFIDISINMCGFNIQTVISV